MIRTLSACLALCVLGTPLPLLAEGTSLNRVVLKQGCALNYPASLHILDREHVEKVEQGVAGAAAASSPQFQGKVSTATLAFAAVDNMERPDLRVTLLILPPEVSQEELKAFDSTQQNRLRDTMFEQASPQFQQLGISITKKWPARIKKGDHLSYFLWGYEFVDQEKVAKVSLRAYYYTAEATFLLQVSCSKAEFDKKSRELGGVLDSLATRL